MNTAAPTTAEMSVDYINPMISATINVFEMMLNCKPTRTGLLLKETHTPKFELSAVIGVTGKAAGTIVLSLSKTTALDALERMVGIRVEEIDADVRDAVGELTNMIAGQAKAQMAQLELSISIPNIVSGSDHVVHYPSNVTPICVDFESEVGPFTIEVGFATITGS